MSIHMCCLSVSTHLGHLQQQFLSFRVLKLMLLPVYVVLGILNMPRTAQTGNTLLFKPYVS